MIITETTLYGQGNQYRIKYIVDDEIVGSCSCLIYQNNKAKVMYVDEVFVEEEHRGKGYGKEIMYEAIEFARTQNVDSVELTVNDDNVIARNLYQKLEFVETSKKYCRRILNIF